MNYEKMHLLTNSVDVDGAAKANQSFDSQSVAICRSSVQHRKLALALDVPFSIHCDSAGDASTGAVYEDHCYSWGIKTSLLKQRAPVWYPFALNCVVEVFLDFPSTFIIKLNHHHHHYHQSVLLKGMSFTASAGTYAIVLPKGRSSTANSGTKAAVLSEIE